MVDQADSHNAQVSQVHRWNRDPDHWSQSGLFRSLFGPRSIGGGRIQVIGCSPGCLVLSLFVSLILTLLLNAIF